MPRQLNGEVNEKRGREQRKAGKMRAASDVKMSGREHKRTEEMLPTDNVKMSDRDEKKSGKLQGTSDVKSLISESHISYASGQNVDR